MGSKYPAYPDCKNSNVEWIGSYPSGWGLTRVKFESYVKARVGWHGLKSDDFTDEGPYLVTGSDFRGPVIKWDECYHCDLERYEQDPYIQLKDGDLLITKDGTIGKVALVCDLDGNATLNSGVFVVRPLGDNYTSKFYFWLLQSSVFTGFVDFNKTGSTIVHLYQDTFVNFRYAIPSLNEQLVITNFLDHETAKIDTLIEKQQQLIKLLKEKRQAVISHAVTKGLTYLPGANLNSSSAAGPKGEGRDSPSNPDAPMRDSGVEWLGEVPGHWKVASLGYYSTISTGATPDRSKHQYWGGDIPWIKTGEVRYDNILETEEHITLEGVANSAVTISPPGTLLMAMYGQGVTRGRVALLGIPATYNQACAAITPNKKIWNQYLRYFFMAAYHAIRDGGNETSQMNLNADIVSKFKVTIPDITEQHKVVEFLDVELESFDVLLEKAVGAIELMQERRTALISAAVTGKIDVRDWVAPEQHTNKEDAA